MEIQPNYSEKSFVVRGEKTKEYSENLKQIGGRFIPSLKGGAGWVFSNKRFDDVSGFVDRVNNNQELPIPKQPRGRQSTSLYPQLPPTSYPQPMYNQPMYQPMYNQPMYNQPMYQPMYNQPMYPPTNPQIRNRTSQNVNRCIPPRPTEQVVDFSSDYQVITWTVFKPVVGMIAKITMGNNVTDYLVDSVDDSSGVAAVAIISSGNTKKKLVVCNGDWQILGVAEQHTVEFLNQ